MKKILLGFFILCALFSAAQTVSITSLGAAYTENFDALANTATASTLPAGWLFAESGTNANTTYQADNGTSNSGNTFSYGTTASTDRAFGGLQSGSLIPTIGAGYTNNTGSTITSLTITYTGEMWRAGLANRGAADRMDFQYSVDATGLTTGTWIDANSLDYNSSVITVAAASALDGNAASNRTVITATITGLNIPNGSTFYLRWTDFNITSSDDGLAVDDFSLTANTQTQPACTAPTAAPTSLLLTPGSTTIAGSFTAAPSTDGYLVIYSTSGTLGFTPVNTTTYTVGQTAGSGTVVAVSANTTFNITGLTPSTLYYVFVFSLNGFTCTGGPLYFTTDLNFKTFTTAGGGGGVPEGYYNSTTGKTCADLKTTLKTRTGTDINNQPITSRTYTDLWGQYQLSDIKPREVGTGSANVIWDIYSDVPAGADPYNFTPGAVADGGQQDNGTSVSGEGVYYNREHSVPISWFDGSTSNPGAATDYHHIFPTDKWVNALRDSYIYGEVTNPTTTSLNGSKLGPNAVAGLTGTAFEPINAYKGDVARAFLYFVTRYEANMASYSGGTFGTQAFDPTTFPSVDIPYLQLMIKWHNQDPVSQKEIDRNNAAFGFQGNRNPFVDRPEFVGLIWNSSCAGLGTLPVGIISFKGTLKGANTELLWEVQNEVSFNRYEVQRSVNGQDFETIGSVKATNAGSYKYADNIENLTGRRLYYRLKLIDNNGSSKYSNIYSVHVKLNTRFQVYPNPASSRLTIETGATSFTGMVTLTDMSGRIMLAKKMEKANGSFQLDVQQLATGRYQLKLESTTNSGWTSTQSVTVIH